MRKAAFVDDYPDCDGLYIGGTAWLAEPGAHALKNEFVSWASATRRRKFAR
jgi:hypothetical protein